ncbi:uncharacterized protein LOC100907919 [Galendromus occidentalis]|uniref:Uncharacterized protein LOC100907919 n=1 Tax=Galendromus occidentalis TaxID=34638 RepID=A0AAJ7SHR6_9ACAR|nr:uncharacterized protein LOC100907919 [Galendromus occidentalis]
MPTMSSLLQSIKLVARAANTSGDDRAKKETSSSFFDKEDEKNCRNMTFEEQVVYKTQKMYRDPENGLCAISRELGAPEPMVPERKINILIIGNHSSGKSTFINWYVGEKIQKTGVAMETSNFTFVCHGRRRETLTAGTILKLFPALQAFEKIPGAMDHLSGEVSTSASHRFPLVNFIDSPGIVDGNRYNYDFDRCLETCAEMADLIFVFFDPHGQALCQKTLFHLERLCLTHPTKLTLFMTKCDTVNGEHDLVKVTQQISRELAGRPEIARQELWLTPIYVPGHSDNQPAGLNNLQASRSLIDKSIARNLQNKVLGNIVHRCDYLEKLNAYVIFLAFRSASPPTDALVDLPTTHQFGGSFLIRCSVSQSFPSSALILLSLFPSRSSVHLPST